jgi:phytoene dehydrogenase-like protein
MQCSNTFDTIVVGGGHNSLSAAAYLAKAGQSVLVLEKNAFTGGGVVTQEVTVPGFLHELHATAIFLIKANPLLANDELGLYGRHGLESVDIDGPYFTSVFDDDSYLATYFDLDKTCTEIARFSKRDADTYRDFTHRNGKLLKLIIRGMFTPPIGIGALLKLVGDNPDGRYLTRLMFSSAFDVINQYFENGYVRCHLYKWISENCISPDEVGTGLLFLLLLGLGHVVPPGVFKGGNQRLSDALVAAVEHYGGDVRTQCEVTRFNVSGGRITGVTLASGEVFHARKSVVASTPCWDLHKFINGLDQSLLGDIEGLKPSNFTVFLTHYALKEAPKFRVPDEYNKSFVTECMINDLDQFRGCYDRFKYNEMPKFFSGHSVCSTHVDPTRAPGGQHTLYLYHYIPLVPRGKRLEDWPDIKDGFADWILENFRRYATNMEDSNILGRFVESPYEMQMHSPSFRNGDCFGLSMTPRQFLGERPTPELAQYRVPGVEGLYLCGPAQHPGGGCIGGGRPVAMRIMMDQNMDLKTAFDAL